MARRIHKTRSLINMNCDELFTRIPISFSGSGLSAAGSFGVHLLHQMRLLQTGMLRERYYMVLQHKIFNAFVQL